MLFPPLLGFESGAGQTRTFRVFLLEKLLAGVNSRMPRTAAVVRSAEYQCLGDLRWVSEVELRQLHYIGLKRAAGIAQTIRTLESGPENSAEKT